MKKLIPVLLLLFLTISGCSDGRRNNETPSRETAASGKDLPVIDNEDLTPGLKGIDADGNGIRDDIDRLIAKKYSTTSMMKKVAELHARALQQSMEATTREQAKAAGNEIFRASDCMYKFLPHATPAEIKFRDHMSLEIEALTVNTKERFKAYWRSESLTGGMVFQRNNNPLCQ
jgi:hypothetical protein